MGVNPSLTRGATRESPCGRITKIRAGAAWFSVLLPHPLWPGLCVIRAADDLGVIFGRIAGGTSWSPSKAKFAAFAFHGLRCIRDKKESGGR
jgi:hypothetical protein